MILGKFSAHRHEYTNNCLKKSEELFDGVPIFIGKDPTIGHNTIEDLQFCEIVQPRGNKPVGYVRRPKFKKDGIYAEIVIDDTTPDGFGLYELIKSDSTLCGFCPTITGKKYPIDEEWSVVYEIKKVISVDIVFNPATANGFFHAKPLEFYTT